MSDKFEIVLVLNPDLDESAAKAEIAKITETIKAGEGQIDKEDIWGKRQLSYQINDRSFGNYILLEFTCNRPTIAELERQLKLTDNVLRHLIVKKDRFAPDGRPTDTDEADGVPGSKIAGAVSETGTNSRTAKPTTPTPVETKSPFASAESAAS